MKHKILLTLSALLLCSGAFAQNDTVRSFWKSDYRNGVSIGYSYKKTAPSAISLNYRHKWYGVGVEFCLSEYSYSTTMDITPSLYVGYGWDGTEIPNMSSDLRIYTSAKQFFSLGYVLINPNVHLKYISFGCGVGLSWGEIIEFNTIMKDSRYFDLNYAIGVPVAREDISRRNKTIHQGDPQYQMQYLFHIKPNVSVRYPIKNWEVSVNVGYSIIPQKNKTENYALAKCDGFSFGAGIGYMW